MYINEYDNFGFHVLICRFMDMIIALRDYLISGSLPVYFNEDINILDDYQPCQTSRILGYLRRIANKGRPIYAK